MVPVRAYDSDSFTNSENQNERDNKVVIVFYMATSPKIKDLALRLLFTDCKRPCKRDLGASQTDQGDRIGNVFQNVGGILDEAANDLRPALRREGAAGEGQKEYRRQQERADMICKTTAAALSI